MRVALVTILATIMVPGVAVILTPYLILQGAPTARPPELGLIEIGSLVIALIGIGMVVWVSVTFVTKGKGTPVPIDPPKEFVAVGLYRFVRNPMYFGALLAIFAQAVFFRSA